MDILSLPVVQQLMQKVGWERLEKREKILVCGMLVFVFVFLLYVMLLAPLLENRANLQKSLISKEAELQKIRALQQEYLLLQTQSDDIQARIGERTAGFTLFSYVERQAADAGVKKNIKYLKPSEVEGEGVLQEVRVDMKLERINTENLVAFLKGLESEEQAIYVSRLSIKEHGKDQGYMNTVIQVITFKLKGAAG